MSKTEEPFLLTDCKNFKSMLNCSSKSIVEKIIQLCCHYNILMIDFKPSSNSNYKNKIWIATRGLNSIITIFQVLLIHTKNLEFSYYHANKSLYLYVEFISQLSFDDNTILKLSSRDAVLYLYKKTIFSLQKTSGELLFRDRKKIQTSNYAISLIKNITLDSIQHINDVCGKENIEQLFKILLMNIDNKKMYNKSSILYFNNRNKSTSFVELMDTLMVILS